MRKIIYLSLITLISLISLSCEEDFTPKTTFKEQYILNCILNASANVTTQVATLYKNYNMEGFDPYTNKIDPALIGADIKLYYKGVTYTFRDTTMVRTDTSRYNDLKSFYVVTGIKFKSGDSVKIVATLKNGVVLSSAIKIPPTYLFKVNKYTIDPTTPTDIGNMWGIGWETNDYSLLFSPRFIFNYYKKINGKDVAFKKEIPMRYLLKDNAYVPFYPPISKTSSITFDYAVFDSLMTQISADEPDKNLFKIGYTTFQLITLEENLASYYSISNGYMDDVSIRLDEGEFSNIKGGLGVFGAYVLSSSGYSFDDDYIYSFGYLKTY